MQQYLSEIKFKVDTLAVAGSSIDPKDIILYILNGFPSTNQAFKITIKTNFLTIKLRRFLFCSLQ